MGCAPSALPITSTSTESQPASPTLLPPASTLTPTLRPTQTLTLTPPIMLEPKQAKDTIKSLLQETIDCEAPCFWGIVPGQTTLGEAKNIFARLGLAIKSETYEGKDFHGIKYDFDSGLSIIVTLTVQDKVIENLRVDILPEEQKAEVPREWFAFSPETLIYRYGAPSKVDLFLDWGPNSVIEMNMYFDAVDLIVSYGGYNIISNQKSSPHFCPLNAQFDSVRIWMGKDPYAPPSESVPLEEATSMNMDEFSKLMTGDPSKACFNLDATKFP